MPRFNCQHGPTLNMMLRNPAIREATLDQSRRRSCSSTATTASTSTSRPASRRTATCSRASWPSSRARLHALGKRLAVEVSAKFGDTTTGRSGFYDYPALGRVADTVFVMAWGWHWTTSGPGPVGRDRERAEGRQLHGHDAEQGALRAGTAAVRARLARTAAARRIPRRRASTARRWRSRSGTARRRGSTPTSYTWTFNYVDGGVPHEVWFGDATTVSRRIKVAQRARPRPRVLAARPRGPAHLGRPPDRPRHRLAVAQHSARQSCTRTRRAVAGSRRRLERLHGSIGHGHRASAAATLSNLNGHPYE